VEKVSLDFENCFIVAKNRLPQLAMANPFSEVSALPEIRI